MSPNEVTAAILVSKWIEADSPHWRYRPSAVDQMILGALIADALDRKDEATVSAVELSNTGKGSFKADNEP